MDAKAIGKKIEQMRLERNMTQASLAAEIGVTPMAISLYESGGRVPRDEIKMKLCDYFGVTVSALFFDSK